MTDRSELHGNCTIHILSVHHQAKGLRVESEFPSTLEYFHQSQVIMIYITTIPREVGNFLSHWDHTRALLTITTLSGKW